MISCTEFIPAYSELFKYMEKRGGKAKVLAYWEHIANNGIGLLHDEVAANGIRGCYNYWSHTLNEEAADFTMTLDEDKGEFSIVMHHCPSKGRLLEFRHLTPYPDYCEHCDLLYRRILEPLGYNYDLDMSKCDQAQCAITVKK